MTNQNITPKKLPIPKSERHQNGSISEVHGAFHIRYYVTEIINGVPTRKLRSKKLCDKDRNTGHGAKSAKAVQALAADHMRGVNSAVAPTPSSLLTVVEFWEKHYLPYCETGWKGTGMRASSIKGFKQVWKQHLKDHFGTITLQQYTAKMARGFLQSLKTKQGKNTLKHIRSLASAMFSDAIESDLLNGANPWKVNIPKDCKESEPTQHYTMEEAENLISVLVEHVDAQLVVALSCFLGLGPAEISGLQWGDVDADWIHIRRNKPAHGVVGAPKTKERQAPLPTIDQVRVPLELWRAKCAATGDGDWVIVDLPNMTNRVIKPHVIGGRMCERCEKTPKASGVTWKGLYAGRRGAITAIIEATGGNYAVAQALARHKSMTTTLNVYKKQITTQGFVTGMQTFQKSLTK
jgi:integrase